MSYRSFTAMLVQMDEFIDLHDAKQSNAKDKIRGGRYGTLQLVGRKTLKKAQRLVDQPAHGMADPYYLPSFYTCRAEFARLLVCSERTVYNHLFFLEQAGVLQKTFHGTKCNLELTLHPWFYFYRGFKPPVAVDLSELAPQAAGNQMPAAEVWTRKNLALPVEEGDVWEQAAPARELFLPPPPVAPVPALSPEEELRRYGMEYTRVFWQEAREKMWPGEYFSPDYERRILNLIWSDVMCGFVDCTVHGHIIALYRVRLAQLTAAIGYAGRNGWKSFLPPLLYFSHARFEEELANNTRGSFWWTFEWFKRSEESKEWLFRQRKVSQALRSLTTGKLPKAMRKNGEMTRLQLYRYWEQRLGQHSDPELLRNFQQEVAMLKLADF